jgi:nucleotide-binding universal stress UspA family protein
MSDAPQRHRTAAWERAKTDDVFARPFCGVDRTPESLEAVRQADRLAPPRAMLHLLTAVNPAAMAPTGFASTLPLPDLEERAWARLREAEELLVPDRSSECFVVVGPEVAALSEALADGAASVVVLGTHWKHRTTGLALGSVATAMLRHARCSALVARKPPARDRFPESVVVGYDGSEPATRALQAAKGIADRLGSELWAVLAADGGAIAADTARVRVGEAAPGVSLEVARAQPVDGLSGCDCDLLVLGSRGLGRARALGSVSERVAHRARCSVLVVR